MSQIKKILVVKDVPRKEPCNGCNICIRLRLLELGIIPGQKISLKDHKNGLWTLNVLGENNISFQTLALRDDEVDRILFEEENCIVGLI